MRTERVTWTFLTWDELNEDQRAQALDKMRAWDFGDEESIQEAIVASLCDALGVEYEGYGTALPGSLELTGWDLDRGESLSLRGSLVPEDIPAVLLPAWVEEVRFGPNRYQYACVDVLGDDGADVDDLREYEEVAAIFADVIRKGVSGGREQLEYLSSDEYLSDLAECNEMEWQIEDGRVV